MSGRRVFVAGVVVGVAVPVGLLWLDEVLAPPPRPWLVSSWRDKPAAIRAWERRQGWDCNTSRAPLRGRS